MTATDEQVQLEHVDCIFCGNVGTHPYHTENGYQAVSCDGCGLVFVTPRPTETLMKHLYEGQETKIDLARQIGNIEAITGEARRSLKLIQAYRRTGHILEIGCAAGYFLREAEKWGFQATGIDMTRQFVEFANHALGVNAKEGTLTGLDLPVGSYDIVYHRNVLSHLAYPIESFGRMRTLLKPGGLMVFQTGNVAELPSSRWAGTTDLDLPDHLFHYGESTLRKLLMQTGFSVLEVRRYALVAHDPWVRSVGNTLQALTRRPLSAAKDAYHPPRHAPRSNRFREAAAMVDQTLTYGIGRLVSSHGRRCTLKVVAQRDRQ